MRVRPLLFVRGKDEDTYAVAIQLVEFKACNSDPILAYVLTMIV